MMVRLLMETSTGDGLASCWNKHGWQVRSGGSREKTTGLCGLGHKWQACLKLWAFIVVAGFVRQKNENNLKLGHAWKKKMKSGQGLCMLSRKLA